MYHSGQQMGQPSSQQGYPGQYMSQTDGPPPPGTSIMSQPTTGLQQPQQNYQQQANLQYNNGINLLSFLDHSQIQA